MMNKDMRLLILYFSGTGNTDYIARYLKKKLKFNSPIIDISLLSIENCSPDEIMEYDIICFGFPVFELNSPVIVRNFLAKLSPIQNKGVFIFCTMGLWEGNAIRKIYKPFKKNGYKLLGSMSIIMPGTDGLAMLNKNSKYVKKALEKDYKNLLKVDKFTSRIIEIAEKLSSGEKLEEISIKPPFKIASTIIGPPFHLIYLIMVKFMKKKFKASEDCTLCELCVKNCPVQNISIIDRKIVFGDQCIMCLRCIHQCPAEAVQIGKKTIGKFRWHGPLGDFRPKKYEK
ncbi:EFR1 family ferrodoxin [Promethearchaeum syntrophicum]|uniref:EFR1 family ferrodoxin n=1 Tax=Promethearchaeum syntrophicum TaxID=2594042 RepID=A0A5B9DCR0_9ARCH|nr:EFR1 family ferrodoxin [Candidatus Prometheoarchaeum syntrophicum]QEE16902.1 flavodoxin [Candidatus Prometheoarchaeum syntrophicum]